ncbi:DUF551 domain-containing protein [Franconibacter helveticus]|uniref:DUF551 domain-containing protein n=1 Tax=Franconibacter helveticus TaxID=357240 RepID=UPI000DA202C2|nr:DUF551 domain-containing protein [Franconibacter helveticus]
MKEVTIDRVRARIAHIESLNARGVGTKVEQQQFELACLRNLLELLALRERAEPECYGPYTPTMIGAGVWVSITDELPPHLEGREVWVTTALPAPPAPVVVPDEMPETESEDGNDIDYMEPSAIYELGKTHGWNAYRAAMLQGVEPVSQPYKLPDGWIKCSERLPEKDGNYWAWWSESKRQGPAWFIKSELQAQFQSSEITHWMPLPAAPGKEG